MTYAAPLDLGNRICWALFALIWAFSCCATAPLLAQQSDRGSDLAVPSDHTINRTARATSSVNPRETEIEETDISNTEKPQLSWKPEWPRHRLVEYLAVPVLGITALTLRTQVDNPDKARVRGCVLLDRPMQNLLSLSNRDDRLLTSTISDFGFFGLQFYSMVVDVLLVSLVIHELPDVALELAVMTLQALAISHTLVAFTKKVVGRERPYSERCDAEGDHVDPYCNSTKRYTSFLSGHTLGAFTGAGVICAQHQVFDLYGGGAVEELVCGSALAVASVTGVLRIMSDRHWFSDVFISAAVGLASGWLLPWLLHFQFDESDTQNSAFNNGMIVPLLDLDVYGVGYVTVY